MELGTSSVSVFFQQSAIFSPSVSNRFEYSQENLLDWKVGAYIHSSGKQTLLEKASEATKCYKKQNIHWIEDISQTPSYVTAVLKYSVLVFLPFLPQ